VKGILLLQGGVLIILAKKERPKIEENTKQSSQNLENKYHKIISINVFTKGLVALCTQAKTQN